MYRSREREKRREYRSEREREEEGRAREMHSNCRASPLRLPGFFCYPFFLKTTTTTTTGTLPVRYSLIDPCGNSAAFPPCHCVKQSDPICHAHSSVPQPRIQSNLNSNRLLQPQPSTLDRHFSRSRPPFQPINTPGGLGKSRAHVALTMCRLLLASAGMTAAWLSI